MRKVKSCGIILFTSDRKKFLLMEHKDRFDIPKGHIEKGETEIECALREFEEETGIKKKEITIDENFIFEEVYFAKYKKFNFEKVEKTLIVYLAFIEKTRKIKPTEHIGYRWVEWKPPHKIQKNTIDKLLSHTAKFFNGD